MTNVTVKKVTTRDDHKRLFEFPWHHYKGDPWVPNLVSARRKLLDQDKHPSWDYMDGDYFIAERNGEIVGTIAATINHRHNDFTGEHVGGFGLFECIDDQEVASALLNTAADWVRDRGYDAIRGPQTFTLHEECGILIDNFSQPVVLMPYNKPYYQRLLENAGFVKAMDVYSLYLDRPNVIANGLEERLKKVADYASKRYDFTVRPLDMSRKQAEFKIFRDLYNDAWAENWGFVPMTDAELDILVEDLGQLVDPRVAFFAESKGEPIGFSLTIPDFNQVLARAYPRPGVPEPFTLVKALWYWKVKKVINNLRLPLMGVRKQFRNRGVDTALIYHTVKTLVHETDYHSVDSGWVLETNPLVQIIEKYGGQRYKTHRFYERTFNS